MMYGTILPCLLLVMVRAEIGEDNPISPSDQEWLNSLFYLPETPRVRKEYRMLTDKERKTFHNAFLKLKQDRSVSPNKYDLLASLHARRSSRNSAHQGPGFLGWHRVFTLLMENALREKEPNVTMAYWDSTLDGELPVPRNSCLWSEDFMGNGDGFVKIGVFKDWTTQADKLYRTVGIMEGPLTHRNISRLFKFSHIGNISYPKTALKDNEHILELTHNRVHRWVGGEMRIIQSAADDPFFFIYHSFISLIWEDFRNHQRSKGIDPETDWDIYYGAKRHHKYAPMGLGNLMAIDGSSEIFAENIIFAQRPSCSKMKTDCGSPYLYCNVSTEKCMTWTLHEYKTIKQKTISTNKPFDIEVKIYKDRKQSGILDILFDEENENHKPHGTEHDHLDNHGHDSDKSNEYSSEVHDASDVDDDHDDDDDNHHHHHNHATVKNIFREINVYGGRNDGTFIEKYLLMILLAGSLFVLVILTVISKCREENKIVGTNKRKYRMDGIVNVNYAGSERKKEEGSNTQHNESRSDNIYTITITSHTGTPQTFVRFAKYDKEQNKQVGDASNNAGSSSGDYLDMDYASRIMNEAKSCDSDLYEISLETDSEEEGENDFELETTYNSIENENFDLNCLHDQDEPCDQQCYDNATKSIDDVLADYDNLVFRTEAMYHSAATELSHDSGGLRVDDNQPTTTDLDMPALTSNYDEIVT